MVDNASSALRERERGEGAAVGKSRLRQLKASGGGWRGERNEKTPP